MLIFLYSQYVLLALVSSYVLHAIIARVAGVFWRRNETAEGKIEPNPVGRRP
jgi:predicted cobalt transporter CbtA